MKVKTRKQTSSQERGICMVALVSKRPGSSSYHYFWGRPLLSAQISRCGCPSGWDFIQLLFFRTFFCGSSSGRESLGQARKQTEQWPVLPNRYEKTPCPCCEKKNGRIKTCPHSLISFLHDRVVHELGQETASVWKTPDSLVFSTPELIAIRLDMPRVHQLHSNMDLNIQYALIFGAFG